MPTWLRPTREAAPASCRPRSRIPRLLRIPDICGCVVGGPEEPAPVHPPTFPATLPRWRMLPSDTRSGWGGWQGSEAMFGRWLYGALMATPLLLVLPFAVPLGYVIWCGGTGRGLRRAAAKSSWSMLSLLFIVSLMSALAASCTEALLNAAGKSMPARAATDAKTAVTQAIVYAGDKGVYPRSMRGLRDPGYANIRDKDP